MFRIWGKSSEAISNHILKEIKSYRLSLDSFRILELLYSKGPHPVQKISEKFAIPSGSITYVINKLEAQGLVIRRQNPEDGRESKVEMTEKGKSQFDEIFPKHAQAISDQFSVLSEQEKEQLIELLKKVGLNVPS
ncbi:MarR family transcriptional regulator [Saccharibacillus sacchari]|uniref:MarR family transcriptional regulator n=1 Tax=Saccharibacillus sacchari TaxID=456493 RepID=A0ACC6PIH5_9BACL